MFPPPSYRNLDSPLNMFALIISHLLGTRLFSQDSQYRGFHIGFRVSLSGAGWISGLLGVAPFESFFVE